MSMRSINSARRVYVRNGSLVLCLSGRRFGPSRGAVSAIDKDLEVTHRELACEEGDVRRIEVTQGAVTEVWQQKLVTPSRGAHADDPIGRFLPAAIAA